MRKKTSLTCRTAAATRLFGVAMTATVLFLGSPQIATAQEATAAQPAAATADNEGWVPLFNGKDLDGWVQRGGVAKYRVEDNAIVGTTVPKTGNSFLCTPRDYADFIFEFEFKVDPRMNSGVQFRSQYFEEAKTVQHNGKEIKVPAKRVHGYQYEIDPSKRAWSGGIYDEGRRGWLFDLKNKPEAQKAFKQNEWNQARIEARGDSLRTWINGVPAADLKDDMNLAGFIALQVHGVGDKEEPMEVRWRNLRIKELPAGSVN